MERIFTIIGRINSVLLLLVLIAAAGSIVWMVTESNRWQQRGAVVVRETEGGEKKPILLNFDRIEDIAGANTQMIRLSAHEKGGKFSSAGYGGETRNVLFLTGSEKLARWLFKEHKNLVLTSAQLHEPTDSSKDGPSKALYFEYVSKDTNGDGNLSSADHSTIALTRPDGTGIVEILKDVSRVLSYDMIDQHHLSVVYQKGAVVKHARFDVGTMKLIADQEIVNVPSTL